MMKIFFTHISIRHFILVSLFFFIVKPVFAQTTETPDSVRFKALDCLYRSVQSLNNRNARFQAMQKELDDMHPLEPKSLDSVHIKENLVQCGKYLRFLDQHRQLLSKNLRLFADSIHIFKKQMNKEDERESLDKFLTAYQEEAAAFTGYSQRLSLMITDLRSALTFLQTVPMTRVGDNVTFNTDKSANEKYLDFEMKIAADQNAVDAAIGKTIKLSEKENKVIQEATAVLNR
jgi:hypothetical protein